MEIILRKICFGQDKDFIEMTHPQGVLLPCEVIRNALAQLGFTVEIEIKDGE